MRNTVITFSKHLTHRLLETMALIRVLARFLHILACSNAKMRKVSYKNRYLYNMYVSEYRN